MKFERKSIRRFKRVESSKVASSRGAAQTIQWNLKSHSLQLLELPQFSNSIQLFSWSHFLCQVSQVWNSIWGKECGSNKYYLVSYDINSIEISIQHLVTLVKNICFENTNGIRPGVNGKVLIRIVFSEIIWAVTFQSPFGRCSGIEL